MGAKIKIFKSQTGKGKRMIRKEADLQSLCNEWLRRRGWLFYHKEKGRTAHKSHSKGLPDLSIWKNGRGFFIELKHGKGKLSDDQIAWRVRAAVEKIPYYKVDTFDGFIETVKTIIKIAYDTPHP